MTDSSNDNPATDRVNADVVLELTRELVEEMEAEGAPSGGIDLDTSFATDLGFDSLTQAELVRRLEDRFDVTLPERVLTDAESPRDLLREVSRATPRKPEGHARAVQRVDLESEEVEGGAKDLDEAETLLEVLDLHGGAHPDRRHVLFLERGPGEGEEEELTYGELQERADRIAAALQQENLERQARVGLMLPSGLDYFAVFFGVQKAGGVPVPLYPPVRKSQIEDHLRRQAGILDNAQVQLLVTFDDIKPLAHLVRAQVSSLEKVLTPDDLDADPESLRRPEVGADDTAFLQYTSGSTGAPKGVILSHRNLLSNLRSIDEVVDLESEDVVVSWLPLYHDMGLIGAWMGSLYFSMPLVLMSPLNFLSRPVRWLRAIQRYGGTISAAPNFAYELCLEKIDDEEVEDLDLSSWRIALNGAEPVSPRSVEHFPERFGPQGFREETMMPVYGLAESSLAVSFTSPDQPPKIDAVDRETFQSERRAEPAADDAENPQRFVSCGEPIPGHEVRFVDADGEEVEDRQEGCLQFRGPSATHGYFRNPEETERLIRDGWLDSEDLGYRADGEIYLTGRSKDVILRAGRNIHPQEIEDAAGDVEGVRRGCVAAFAARDEEAEIERFVVLAETRIEDDDERSDLRERIAAVTADLVGSRPDEVILASPRTVPKTSSGKIRRSAARELYENQELEAPDRSVKWQVTRLAASAVGPFLSAARKRLIQGLYAAWWVLLVAVLAIPVWLTEVLLPTLSQRRRFVRAVARLLFRLTGTGIDLQGKEQLEEASGPRVVTPVHPSYADPVVLAAALPPTATYVVKNELRGNFVTRWFLRRMGCLFLDEVQPSKEDEGVPGPARRTLEAGHHLVIFPEGRVRRSPSLERFRMGAFAIAARTGTPVVPAVIRGTRKKLPPGIWLPRPGDVSVDLRAPREADGENWSDAVKLRDAVRGELAGAAR